jgi:hypothetical protein
MNNNDEDESQFWTQLCEINEEQYKEEQREGKFDIFLSYFKSISEKDEENEKNFWCLLLEESSRFTTFILSINAFILVLPLLFNDHSHFHIFDWIIPNLVCLYFTPKKKLSNTAMSLSNYETWKYVGYFILCLRLNKVFLLLRKYFMYSSENHTDLCELMEDISEDDLTITIPVAKFLLDTIQSLIFTSIAFPFPFTPIFVISETTIQMVRLRSCLHRTNLSHIPHGYFSLSINGWVLLLSTVSICCFQISMLILSFAKINAQRNNLKYAV